MDTTDLPKTRKEAQAIGAKYYFTGEPCKHGHIALRKTKGACIECLKLEWEANKEKRTDYFQQYNSSEAGKEAKRRYYERNRETVLARAQARPIEAKRAYRKKHKAENPEMYRELVNLRRRRFRNATPPWLTVAQKREIRALYRIAIEMTKTTGARYVVDHIVPLQGETVCGLHVPWNMVVMTQDENLRKSNKLIDNPISQE